jgi:hypothetical protein
VDLATEDGYLVAQHHHLDSQFGVCAKREPDQLQESMERPIEERDGHRGMLAPSGSWRQGPSSQAVDGVLGTLRPTHEDIL